MNGFVAEHGVGGEEGEEAAYPGEPTGEGRGYEQGAGAGYATGEGGGYGTVAGGGYEQGEGGGYAQGEGGGYAQGEGGGYAQGDGGGYAQGEGGGYAQGEGGGYAQGEGGGYAQGEGGGYATGEGGEYETREGGGYEGEEGGEDEREEGGEDEGEEGGEDEREEGGEDEGEEGGEDDGEEGGEDEGEEGGEDGTGEQGAYAAGEGGVYATYEGGGYETGEGGGYATGEGGGYATGEGGGYATGEGGGYATVQGGGDEGEEGGENGTREGGGYVARGGGGWGGVCGAGAGRILCLEAGAAKAGVEGEQGGAEEEGGEAEDMMRQGGEKAEEGEAVHGAEGEEGEAEDMMKQRGEKGEEGEAERGAEGGARGVEGAAEIVERVNLPAGLAAEEGAKEWDEEEEGVPQMSPLVAAMAPVGACLYPPPPQAAMNKYATKGELDALRTEFLQALQAHTCSQCGASGSLGAAADGGENNGDAAGVQSIPKPRTRSVAAIALDAVLAEQKDWRGACNQVVTCLFWTDDAVDIQFYPNTDEALSEFGKLLSPDAMTHLKLLWNLTDDFIVGNFNKMCNNNRSNVAKKLRGVVWTALGSIKKQHKVAALPKGVKGPEAFYEHKELVKHYMDEEMGGLRFHVDEDTNLPFSREAFAAGIRHAFTRLNVTLGTFKTRQLAYAVLVLECPLLEEDGKMTNNPEVNREKYESTVVKCRKWVELAVTNQGVRFDSRKNAFLFGHGVCIDASDYPASLKKNNPPPRLTLLSLSSPSTFHLFLPLLYLFLTFNCPPIHSSPSLHSSIPLSIHPPILHLSLSPRTQPFARACLHTCHQVIRRSFYAPNDVQHKGKFIGEEESSVRGTAGLSDDPTWMVDPVDGTTNFVHRWGLSSAICHMFTAMRGHGSMLNDKPIHVSAQADMKSALLATEIGTKRDAATVEGTAAHISTLLFQVRSLRMAGSCALNLAGVACGRLDLFYEIDFGGPWDVAAGSLIVEEAGGLCFDPSGGPFDVMARRVAASNAHLKAPFVKALACYTIANGKS
ncbi:unnamed protein product [Closterium sp. NIES-64]|nr:unnamed protein product [Closterium sp. NIES-64]